MMDEFHLTPLAANADSADLLEALGPHEESPAESQFCVFRSGRERFCLPVMTCAWALPPTKSSARIR